MKSWLWGEAEANWGILWVLWAQTGAISHTVTALPLPLPALALPLALVLAAYPSGILAQHSKGSSRNGVALARQHTSHYEVWRRVCVYVWHILKLWKASTEHSAWKRISFTSTCMDNLNESLDAEGAEGLSCPLWLSRVKSNPCLGEKLLHPSSI